MTNESNHFAEHRAQPSRNNAVSDDAARPHYSRGGATVGDVKTSVAAAFSLVLGVVALCAVLAVVLSPVAVVLGIVGIIMAVIGMRKARHFGLAGHGIAVTGLVLSIIALVLAILEIIGVATFINMPGWTNWIPQMNS
ncbi:DUF4190 domain-containing protein [Spelaeicoccus albus]|uniref:DUF4190 domain-containing protein n=1 Tax=Spelaeicoccus albus TaxID=1280376 RepID=A0A7Z0D4I5_9MICO|nr:DUF4190 domain-containing protein [Spelaeicoccus albus]NYI68710.1 hypothetical protein [Spelaeicoccus albus]